MLNYRHMQELIENKSNRTESNPRINYINSKVFHMEKKI